MARNGFRYSETSLGDVFIISLEVSDGIDCSTLLRLTYHTLPILPPIICFPVSKQFAIFCTFR